MPVSAQVTQIGRFTPSLVWLHEVSERVASSAGPRSLAHWEEPLKALLPPGDREVLLFPYDSLNYSTLDVLAALSEIMRRAGVPLTGIGPKQNVHLVGFPGNQMRACLQHSLLLHEIGHVWVDASLGADVQASALPAVPVPVGFSDEQWLVLRESSINWARELTCDLVGIALGGAAFVLANTEMLLTLGLDYPPDFLPRSTHPPSRLRMEALLSSFDESKETSEIQSYVGDARQVVAAGSLIQPNDPRVLSFRIAVPILRARVAAVLGSLVFSPMDYSPLVERLKAGTPPNEWLEEQRPASLPEILNAGWIRALQISDQETSGEQHRENVENLAQKAIELAQVHSGWLEANQGVM